MYELFEIKKIISLVKPNGTSGVTIKLSAYTETSGRSVLALFCDNGYLLFYYYSGNEDQPVIRQLNWFNTAGKQINALSFDPSGTWLLVVTVDASVYILPVIPFLDPTLKISHHWRTDNVTEIKLSGQRASLTSVRWWETLQNQHIAVIGSELGEIVFINLINKKEIGGTYIRVGISALDILKDESHDTTYLLITGSNNQQWRLLLEERKSNFYWPFNSEIESVTCNDGSELLLAEKTALHKDDKSSLQKPHKLSKFESGTFLTPQSGNKRNLVSAYNSSSSILQVLEGDLEQMHLFSYHVPVDCKNIVLSDKLIFITQTFSQNENPQSVLRLLSRKFSEICSENTKKKEHQNAEIQSFFLDDEVIAIYKRSFSCCKCVNFQNTIGLASLVKCNGNTTIDEELCSQPILNLNKLISECVSSTSTVWTKESKSPNKGVKCKVLPNVTLLDGCYIVLKDAVWECRLRLPPEILFLSLTSSPTELPMAEKLGVMLGLEIHKLYEIAAEMQLLNGQFAQAVHLYQLSKCPQLKRIAHFMSYGFLSELIAYIQVLFSTKGVEIVSADKCHFANIALHCFAQQAMENVNEWSAVTVAFKKFLRDNVYYDEAVAVKLFSEQGLFNLLCYFTKVRGLHGSVADMLLQTEGLKDAFDIPTFDALVTSRYSSMVCHLVNDDYIQCMTSSPLLQYLAADPDLLSRHLKHMIALLPKINVSQLTDVASLYDPSQSFIKLLVHNISMANQRSRYWSTGSVSSTLNDSLDESEQGKELAREEDIAKFFIFIILMLCHKLKKNHFFIDLIPSDLPTIDSGVQFSPDSLSQIEADNVVKPLACGLAHVCFCHDSALYTWGKASSGRLGNGNQIDEFDAPCAVNSFIMLQVKVLSVSCGALHNLVLSDYGVFSWGSSRYGQLGLGDIQRACQPMVVESLIKEYIVAVECGQYHSLALTKDGRVYSWGWGVHGQLGHGNPEDISFPKLVEYMKGKVVKCLGAGQGHSVLLTNNGEVYAFGCALFGQLGTGSSVKQSLPQLVALPEPMALIATGYFHTVAIGRSNGIYTWGCNPQALRLQAQCSRRTRQSANQNQSHVLNVARIGTNSISPQAHLSPNLVDCTAISSSIAHVSCGSHHSVIVTSSGEIYSWGRNMEGQIGNGARREQKSPSVVASLKNRKIAYASCGADFTIAIESNGTLWGWGKNDCGQIGQKSLEPPIKVASGLSSGRVITIRTNRRMITITQPCRQSLLRPVEISVPYIDVPSTILDSSSFENDNPITTLFQQVAERSFQKLEEYSIIDNYSYGPFTLHATLKAFHSICDCSLLLNHCITFENYQAAAKICHLQNRYDKALEFQLIAITSDPVVEEKEYQSLALYIIEFYTKSIEVENTEKNAKFLSHIMKFWIENNLQVEPLEVLFYKNINFYSYTLSILLFWVGVLNVDNATIHNKFLNLLSVDFCVNMVMSVTDSIDKGYCCAALFKEMINLDTSTDHQIYASDALTAWNDCVPTERLWQEILHNVQKGVISHSSLHLAATDMDALAKSLIAEKLSIHQLDVPCMRDQESVEDCDTIAFSCSHYYTLYTFRATVIPLFKESVLKLPHHKTFLKYLLNCYYMDGIINSACPKCVLNELKSM